MPFLPVLPEERASAEVRKIYKYITRRWGFLPNYFQALGHDPQLLQDQVNLYTNAMNEERGLPKIIKEEIATVVSGINMSSYCLPAHLEILGRMGMDKSLSRRLSIDYKSAPLDPKVMELLNFARSLLPIQATCGGLTSRSCASWAGTTLLSSTLSWLRRSTPAPTGSQRASASLPTLISP